MRNKFINPLQLFFDGMKPIVPLVRSKIPQGDSIIPGLAPKVAYIGLNAYISPNYMVTLNQFDGGSRVKSAEMIENESNLADNANKGVVSQKSQRLIRKSVNWLCQSALPKRVFNRKKNSHFEFKVGFVTLTIPSEGGKLTGHDFQKKLLNPWLTLMRSSEGLINYVWKLELQKNKSIHCHISVDCFIHHSRIRSSWNALLKRNGLLDAYRAKFSGCTFREYCKLVGAKRAAKPMRLRKAWREGSACDWTSPNSTDVHSVIAVSDLAAYISKYMSKENELNERWRGRIWGCSKQLSQANKAKFYIPAQTEAAHLEPWLKKDIKSIPIMGKPNVFGTSKRCGEVFLFNPSYWSLVPDNPISERYWQIIAFLQSKYSDSNYEYTLN